MCGLFGYISKTGEPVNLDVLAELATDAARRGDHAWGTSQIHNGELMTYRQQGDMAMSLDRLEWLEGATAVVGHTRFSTSGDPAQNINNQPIEYEATTHMPEFVMAHNGQVDHARYQTCLEQGTHQTGCDSESIGRIAQQFPKSGQPEADSISGRVANAIKFVLTDFRQKHVSGGWQYEALSTSKDYAVTLLTSDGVYMTRDGNPLNIRRTTGGGLYWSSYSVTLSAANAARVDWAESNGALKEGYVAFEAAAPDSRPEPPMPTPPDAAELKRIRASAECCHTDWGDIGYWDQIAPTGYATQPLDWQQVQPLTFSECSDLHCMALQVAESNDRELRATWREFFTEYVADYNLSNMLED